MKDSELQCVRVCVAAERSWAGVAEGQEARAWANKEEDDMQTAIQVGCSTSPFSAHRCMLRCNPSSFILAANLNRSGSHASCNMYSQYRRRNVSSHPRLVRQVPSLICANHATKASMPALLNTINHCSVHLRYSADREGSNVYAKRALVAAAGDMEWGSEELPTRRISLQKGL